jgi:hypothetical protein
MARSMAFTHRARPARWTSTARSLHATVRGTSRCSFCAVFLTFENPDVLPRQALDKENNDCVGIERGRFLLFLQPAGYFESAPNHDSIGLRVADDDLAASIYQSMISIEGLRPCAFVSLHALRSS